MEDYLVRAAAADLHIRAFAVRSTNLVQKAREIHQTSPVCTAALGRLLTAGAMMGSMMKGDKDIETLQIRSDGPIKGLTVTSDNHGNVKGFINNPQIEIPLKDEKAGKLDVGTAVGSGVLSVIMDLGLKEPYTGQCALQTGEIGDDLAYYFTVSQQTPSAVGLGVMIDTDCSVKEAGGFIIQLMPDCPEESISKLEKRLAEIHSVTKLMEQGMTPEEMLEALLSDQNLEFNGSMPVQYHCNCSRDRVLRSLAAISTKDIQELIEENKPVEMECYFCHSKYSFSPEELKKILEQRRIQKAEGKEKKEAE